MSDTILKKLGIEGNYEGIGNLTLGYAPSPPGRLRRERQIIHSVPAISFHLRSIVPLVITGI